MQKFLIIQTAFIGDVVLATAVVEKLSHFFHAAQIDVLVRKGNEPLLENNPFIHQVFTWNKKQHKTKNLFKTLFRIRRERYDKVINLQRYFSTGLLTVLSGGKETIGFDKNPLSLFFSRKIKHSINTGLHEVERNNMLIESFTDAAIIKPQLYPSTQDYEYIKQFITERFITITPSSVWYTKQYPLDKWVEFINLIPEDVKIYLLGGPDNKDDCNYIISKASNKNISTLAGELGFLQSAALMKYAKMNYANDSAPLHFASGVDAPVTAVFCSTVPSFGFTPLSVNSNIVETTQHLGCRPCGLHGYKACPLGHFKCAYTITPDQLINILK